MWGRQASRWIVWIGIAVPRLLGAAETEPPPVVGPDGALGSAVGMSDADRLAADAAAVGAVRDLAESRLAEASGQLDIIQVNCINRKLELIRGLVKICDDAVKAYREASAGGDAELMQHQVDVAAVARGQADTLKTEVEGCVGESVQHTGETELTSEVDGDIRDDDPTDEGAVPDLSTVESVRPQVDSPADFGQ